MNRHFARCLFCERPISFECESTEVEFIVSQACPLCGEKELRYMGEVHQTDIVRKGVKAACDLRCTNAVGPKCDCVCVNANHGTHRLVVFNKVVGKLEVVNKEILNNNEEYLARIKRMAAAKVDIRQRVVAFLGWKFKAVLEHYKNPNYYLTAGEWHDLKKYYELKRRIEKIEDLKSIQRKINQLVKLIPQIGNNLDYIEAVGLAKGLVK
jgi:hypothetical protein